MRLIDADELLIALNTWDKFGSTQRGLIRLSSLKDKEDYVPYIYYEDAVNCIKNMPTAIS